MWRAAKNYLCNAMGIRAQGWHPLLAVYYLTYACDFRCPYCSDGARRPYWALESHDIEPEAVIKLLGRIRRYCDHLVITGGEPLAYEKLDIILERLPSLDFDAIVFTTNGYALEPHLDALSRSIRYLVFSLDTLDEAKADRWFGKGPGTLRRIKGNIDRAAACPERRFEIIVSSVATPDNIEDLYAVYDYCQARGFRFAACPELQGVDPHPALRDNPAYRRLFDYLLSEKRAGRGVNGSLLYLEYMRDLREFHCHPFTTLAVAPPGDVFYPCLEIGKVAGNLLENPDLHQIRRQGLARFGPQPACGNQCHSACALGFSLLLNRPASIASELGLMLKSRLPLLGKSGR